MTRRQLEASTIRKLLLTATLALAGCTTPSIEDAAPLPAISTADAAVPGRPVPEDSRVFSDDEVDARTQQLRARSGRGGGGGGGDGASARDSAIAAQEDVLRRIEESGN